MVIKKIETRDYLRKLITRANKEAGVKFNSSKLNSKEECEEYLLNLIKNLRHKKQDNKAYIKEIDSLKEEIEILKNGNRSLESQKDDEEEIDYFKNCTRFWHKSYREEMKKNNVIKKFNNFLSFIIVLEAVSMIMLIWK